MHLNLLDNVWKFSEIHTLKLTGYHHVYWPKLSHFFPYLVSSLFNIALPGRMGLDSIISWKARTNSICFLAVAINLSHRYSE
jgi:hypothetical protein